MEHTIIIENEDILGGSVTDVEPFYAQVAQAPPARQYSLDMAAVSFVRSYGTMALMNAARQLSQRSGTPLLLKNLRPNVHSYLHFMRLFELGGDFMQVASGTPQPWQPANSPDHLQLTYVTGSASVEAVVDRARAIYSYWLQVHNYSNLMSVISELGANIYQHSGDVRGGILMQKIQSSSRDRVEVRLAVSDLGQGIRRSLSARHKDIGTEPLDYLRAALQGKSARASGRGGMGLQTMDQFVRTVGGYWWLRSETAAIFREGSGQVQEYANLVNVPGTQVAVELHAPRPD